MEQAVQTEGAEPIAGLRLLTGSPLPGVSEPFAWLDGLFLDVPRKPLRVVHADELEHILDDELVEEEPEEEDELLEEEVEEVQAVAVPVAKAVPLPAADPLANLVLDALRGKPAAAAQPEVHRVFGRFWQEHLPQPGAARSAAEASFVMQLCGLTQGARLLDAGCGAGRHAIEFARRGIDTAGVDLSEALLEIGRERAATAALPATFLQADLRTLGFNASFQACVLLDSTLGLHEDGETVEILRRLAASLVPGGKLVVEVLNRDFVLGMMPARKWLETNRAVILDDVSFHPETSRLRVKRSVAPHGGKAVDFSYSLRLYGLHELRVLLALAGFEVVEVAGSIHQRGAYLGSRDRAIWVLARKRAA